MEHLFDDFDSVLSARTLAGFDSGRSERFRFDSLSVNVPLQVFKTSVVIYMWSSKTAKEENHYRHIWRFNRIVTEDFHTDLVSGIWDFHISWNLTML